MRYLLNIFSTGTTVSSFGILRLCKRIVRNNPPEVFLGKYVLEKCSKFTGENTCRSVISIKLLCKFIKITLPHGCSPVNILHIFRTFFLRTPLEGCFCIVITAIFHKWQVALMLTLQTRNYGREWEANLGRLPILGCDFIVLLCRRTIATVPLRLRSKG